MKRRYQAIGWTLVCAGCASGPLVRGSDELPVRNVVLYRSGVAYFERSGKFEGDSLEFGVKQSEVGDFLASLTAIERTSGGISSIAFDVPEAAKSKRECKGEDPACEAQEDVDDARVDVRLLLDRQGEHDLSVAYVVGAPIWRPSYRIVFDRDQKALLQAWAVVQNTSGEDWQDVSLALTTGAPISFRSDLGTPIVPERPRVTDTGEVVMAVPVGDVVVAQEAPSLSMDSMAAPMEAEAMEDQKASGMATRAPRRSAPASAPPPAPHKPMMSAEGLAQSVRTGVALATLGDSVTSYEIAGKVTVPDGGSTMVAIVSARVPGERAHLFAPDGGVGLSYQHPFAVARLTNATGAVLEKGPVSVLGDGAFLGQGVLDTLPRDADAFLPYALDKSVVVEPSQSYSEEQGVLLRVVRDIVTVQRFSQRKTTYRVRNGGTDPTKLYVRHERWGEAELYQPKAGTELTPGRALVPMEVAGKGKAELEVIERTPVTVELMIMDQAAADALTLFLSGPAIEAAQGDALKRALALRKDLVTVQENLVGLEREQGELANGADETRQNLKAIEKVTSASDLRARLVARLKQLDARLAEITQALVEARTRQSELEVRLKDALEGVSLTAK